MNRDPYREIAAKVFGIQEAQVTKEQRQQAKTFAFMILYTPKNNKKK